jgi:hypothetical protein
MKHSKSEYAYAIHLFISFKKMISILLHAQALCAECKIKYRQQIHAARLNAIKGY